LQQSSLIHPPTRSRRPYMSEIPNACTMQSHSYLGPTRRAETRRSVMRRGRLGRRLSERYDQSGCTPSGSHSLISYADNQSSSWASRTQTVQLLMSWSLAAPGRRTHIRTASPGGGTFHRSPDSRLL
jgi:hypothetical protein